MIKTRQRDGERDKPPMKQLRRSRRAVSGTLVGSKRRRRRRRDYANCAR